MIPCVVSSTSESKFFFSPDLDLDLAFAFEVFVECLTLGRILSLFYSDANECCYIRQPDQTGDDECQSG